MRKQIDDEGEETNKLELDIDGLQFSKHQFLSDDFVLEDEKQLIYSAGLEINGVTVFDECMNDTWSS